MKIEILLTLCCEVDGVSPETHELTDAVMSAISDAVPGVIEVSDDCVLLMNSFEMALSDSAMSLESLAREVRRLQELCRDVHDRMLRGDGDDLLIMRLETAWKFSHE